MLNSGTAVCIASGPSLSESDCEVVSYWRASNDEGRVFVVNNSYLRYPSADFLYGSDQKWWDYYAQQVLAGEWPKFLGQKWTQSSKAAIKHAINWIAAQSGEGFPTEKIYTAGNSGYQAVQLAVFLGFRRIVLLGYDMQPTRGRHHWHPDHPKPLSNPRLYAAWAERMDRLYEPAKARGVEIINATRETALKAFPRRNVEEALR
jgi:hypothetical protein